MLHIRNALIEDLPQLLAIRNSYVANTIVVFDETPFTSHDIELWFASYRSFGPHQLLVAEDSGKLLGFCSSQPYRTHPAFSHTIETGISCALDCRGKGIGSALYKSLFETIAGEQLHRAVAGIALPNDASIALHRKFGFREVGIFNEYARKNDKYISSQWLERHL